MPKHLHLGISYLSYIFKLKPKTKRKLWKSKEKKNIVNHLNLSHTTIVIYVSCLSRKRVSGVAKKTALSGNQRVHETLPHSTQEAQLNILPSLTRTIHVPWVFSAVQCSREPPTTPPGWKATWWKVLKKPRVLCRGSSDPEYNTVTSSCWNHYKECGGLFLILTASDRAHQPQLLGGKGRPCTSSPLPSSPSGPGHVAMAKGAGWTGAQHWGAWVGGRGSL